MRQSLLFALVLTCIALAPTSAENVRVAGGSAQPADDLQRRLADVRERIARLPERSCDLSIAWNDHLALFEGMIPDADAGAEADEREHHAAAGIDDLDRLVSTFELLSNETCEAHAQYVAITADYERARIDALESLGAVIAAARGNRLPFDGVGAEFRDFYRRRDQWPASTDSFWSPSTLTVAKAGIDADLAAFLFIGRRTSVSNGLVAVDSDGGRQRVNARWWTGGSFLSRNRIYYTVWEDFADAFRLTTGRLTRWCAGRSSKRGCWGVTEERMARPTARYRLSGGFFDSLQATLQHEVTARCRRTVSNRAGLEDAVFEHRPAGAPRVRELYDRVAAAFLLEVVRLARNGSGELCAPDDPTLLEEIADRASRDVMDAAEPMVAERVYDGLRRRLQAVLSGQARNLVLAYTVGLGFGLPAQSATGR